jgi:AIG2-like family
VVPTPGGIVHGLLWRLTPRDRSALNAYECLDAGLYRGVTLPVRRGGERAPALVYVGRSRAAGVPRPGYLEQVLAAARELDLPAAYRARLARLARVPAKWMPVRRQEHAPTDESRACPDSAGTRHAPLRSARRRGARSRVW